MRRERGQQKQQRPRHAHHGEGAFCCVPLCASAALSRLRVHAENAATHQLAGRIVSPGEDPTSRREGGPVLPAQRNADGSFPVGQGQADGQERRRSIAISKEAAVARAPHEHMRRATRLRGQESRQSMIGRYTGAGGTTYPAANGCTSLAPSGDRGDLDVVVRQRLHQPRR